MFDHAVVWRNKKVLELWTRKVVECIKRVLMGFASRILETEVLKERGPSSRAFRTEEY